LIIQATAVSPEGRISPEDLGIWKDEQIENYNKLINSLVVIRNRKQQLYMASKQVFRSLEW
jgi:2,4-dienoyl-CoA reductase-like NADH-dependent reductase (Old Yellow Enzyme family)